MKRAPRFPSRWAGWSRSLAITATLSAALGACTSMDNVFYGAREGTMEYPGSAAGPNAVPTPLGPPATAPPPGPTPRFQWPMRGKIITPYGTTSGQKSDGIDIAADNGAPVKAADAGSVVYAGDGVPHLGNLLLIEHSA